MRFDRFIIHFMGFSLDDSTVDEEDIRRRAYRSFLERVSADRPASLPTIRRWFGVRRQRNPSRGQVLRIALALRIGVNETGDFLKKGIGEPSFQINDYTEMIAMYCLERQTGLMKYESLVEEYEGHLDSGQEISHDFNTNWLFQQFEKLRALPEDEFMYWMWEHIGIFKGYSRTAQQYLEKYREMVLNYARRDAKASLDLLLSETGYFQWREKRHGRKGTSEYEQIGYYVKQRMKSGRDRISEHLGGSILELARLAYSEWGMNTRLLSELFSRSANDFAAAGEDGVPSRRRVSAKYLSDLFHIPEQNERALQAKGILGELEKEDGVSPCPEKVQEFIRDNCRGEIELANTEEACDWLREYIQEGKRRRLIVGRQDLLPMILYVSQQKYLQETGGVEASYNKDDAIRVFRELADATLIACHMEPLDEGYAYDAALLSCYQEHEMYGYADVIGAVR